MSKKNEKTVNIEVLSKKVFTGKLLRQLSRSSDARHQDILDVLIAEARAQALATFKQYSDIENPAFLSLEAIANAIGSAPISQSYTLATIGQCAYPATRETKHRNAVKYGGIVLEDTEEEARAKAAAKAARKAGKGMAETAPNDLDYLSDV